MSEDQCRSGIEQQHAMHESLETLPCPTSQTFSVVATRQRLGDQDRREGPTDYTCCYTPPLQSQANEIGPDGLGKLQDLLVHLRGA